MLCSRGPGIDKSLKATQEVDGDMFDCLVARRRSECRRPLEMIRDVTHQANSRHGAQTSKHQSEATDMARIHYQIVAHDGGWAYKLNDVFSEPFPSKSAALAAAKRVAAEQRVSGDTTHIEYEDETGAWHTELSEGDDRPDADVVA